MDKVDARVMYQSTQQTRTYWSGVIVSLIHYVVVLNAAIWAFFGKAYIDSLATAEQPLYITLAAFSSLSSLAAWRIYAHYLDNHIAELYPRILFYEKVLSVPYNYGTIGIPHNMERVFLSSRLKFKEELEVISTLVKKKFAGPRGHTGFDILAFLFIAINLYVGTWSLIQKPSPLKILLCAIIAGSLILGIPTFYLFCCQKPPSKRVVRKTIKKYKQGKYKK